MARKVCALLIIISSLAYTTFVYGITPDWSEYDLILHKYISTRVRSGIPVNWVDYTGMGEDPVFDKVVQSIEAFSTAQLESSAENLSFYINAYNILAMKMVIDHWPVSSIREAGNWLRPVWEKPAGKINGKVVTLRMIEDDYLRIWNEPRIHMAIVCASLSCPDLRAEAYRPEALEKQLLEQTIRFIQNTAKGLRAENNRLHVSKIFDWFKTDFNMSGGVEAFIRRYMDLPHDTVLKADIPYNWDLNGS